MKRRNLLVATLIMFALVVTGMTFAYWADRILPSFKEDSLKISIGSWQRELPSWEGNYNLNIWEEEGTLNQFVPEDVIFSYNGLLYIMIEGKTYNPYWHGLPVPTWAAVAVELDWRPNTNYRTNSVVIRNGKWYIANHQFNTNDWFTNDPETHSGETWSEWREIEPLTEDNFKCFEGTNLKDYRMDPDKVKYK